MTVLYHFFRIAANDADLKQLFSGVSDIGKGNASPIIADAYDSKPPMGLIDARCHHAREID